MGHGLVCGGNNTNYEFWKRSQECRVCDKDKASPYASGGRTEWRSGKSRAKRRLSCMWRMAVSIEGGTYALASPAIALHTNLPGLRTTCEEAPALRSCWFPSKSYLHKVIRQHRAGGLSCRHYPQPTLYAQRAQQASIMQSTFFLTGCESLVRIYQCKQRLCCEIHTLTRPQSSLNPASNRRPLHSPKSIAFARGTIALHQSVQHKVLAEIRSLVLEGELLVSII